MNNIIVDFTCPACKEKADIIEISVGIVKENAIESFQKMNDGDLFCEYSDTEYNQEDEEVSFFCCGSCSERFTTNRGELVTDAKGLYSWLAKHDMLRMPDTEI